MEPFLEELNLSHFIGKENNPTILLGLIIKLTMTSFS
jgi:hypothetical protein